MCSTRPQSDATVGRPHIADALIARGIVRDRSEAFDRILHPREGYYEPHYAPDPLTAVRLITDAGGVAIIAHPVTMGRDRMLPVPFLERLIAEGLAGFEIDHRENTEDGKKALRELAARARPDRHRLERLSRRRQAEPSRREHHLRRDGRPHHRPRHRHAAAVPVARGDLSGGAHTVEDMQWGTALEQRIDQIADRMLRDAAAQGVRAALIEFVVFVLKQAWACAFGAILLVVIIAARLFYPDDAALARNDALTLAAVLIQVAMLAFGLETVRELWVILLFHITGTVMELFKTDVGSWSYGVEGVLRIGAVPLFSGFMYAAVGSYMVRVYRLFDLRFSRYPRRWLTAIVAAAIYANFFTHHFWWDARWVLFAAVVLLMGAAR